MTASYLVNLLYGFLKHSCVFQDETNNENVDLNVGRSVGVESGRGKNNKKKKGAAAAAANANVMENGDARRRRSIGNETAAAARVRKTSNSNNLEEIRKSLFLMTILSRS